MRIRFIPAPGSREPVGNDFIAVDDLENRLGSGKVEPVIRAELSPERPCRIRISAEGDESALQLLAGTALTRALVLARESRTSARIYAECSPDSSAMLELYASIGLIDNDALVRMTRSAAAGPSMLRLPEGCTPVSDSLTDPQERAFFLERQKRLFMRQDAAQWLEEASSKPLMKRLLLTTRDGLAGELLCWAENGRGVISTVYTSPAWRRKGVALWLMEAARQYFYQQRIPEISIDVTVQDLPAVQLAATAGYRRSEVLMRLPGMDLDVPARRGRQ